MGKYLINAVRTFQDGGEPPHIVRDASRNYFPHIDTLGETIPAAVHWREHFKHLTQSG